jgi:thymidylate kinase
MTNEYGKSLNWLRDGQPRHHSVALVGMDGSGKSTQADRLRERLRSQGKRVLLVHPFGRKLLAFLPATLADRVAGGADGRAVADLGGRQPGPASRGQRFSAAIELLDIGLYVWLTYVWSWLLALFGNREVWLVSDRSFDDLLIKHRWRRTLSGQAFEASRRWAPVLEQTIWLQTQPGVAMARDHEFSECYYAELYTAYAAAAEQCGWYVVPTTQQSPDQVEAEVDRVLHLPAEPVLDAPGQRATPGPQPAANEIQQPEMQASEARRG